MKVPSKTTRKYWKGLKDATVLATMELAMQHFHYLVLKEPFADAEQMLVLAQEGFSRAFGEKEASEFVVDPDMVKTVCILF